MLEFSYHGLSNVTPVLKLRPYYDAMFDINDKGKGISDPWESNLVSGLNAIFGFPPLRQQVLSRHGRGAFRAEGPGFSQAPCRPPRERRGGARGPANGARPHPAPHVP